MPRGFEARSEETMKSRALIGRESTWQPRLLIHFYSHPFTAIHVKLKTDSNLHIALIAKK